ncbi:hypothetical protein JCM5296_000696 [Sporobolomyces johnsonii]
MSSTRIPVTFGAMTFGKEGTFTARVHDLDTIAKMLDVFQAHGHKEIDTALVYGEGTSEELLGELDWKKRGLIMDTKLYPSPSMYKGIPITHSGADIRKWIKVQLDSLKTNEIDMFYLHGPDRNTPFSETLSAVDELYKEGKFKRFGVSNYMSWEVAQMVTLCEANGWIKPTAYQGIYNALHRNVEAELFPCLRKLGLSFYAFNPLAGGFLAGRYSRETEDEAVEKGSRFDPNSTQGKLHRARYWNEPYFQAIDLLEPLMKQHNLTLLEIALRWMMHHSMLAPEKGDNLIVGASSVQHLEANLSDLEKGPLPDEVVEALDEGWGLTKSIASKYWH